MAAPVNVGGGLWGSLAASTREPAGLPEDTERRLRDFAELVAQALANADARDRLAASRARLVEVGDAERQRVERNLHDGAQQQLVALALRLRIVESRLDQDADAARAELTTAREQLDQALAELRELARGIHPAVLTDRGLKPAVDALVNRAPVPMEVADFPDARLPEPVETAAYYLIAEAVTNVAKYAQATHVAVSVRPENGHLVVRVSDDGVGGADPVGRHGPARADRPRRGAPRAPARRQPARARHAHHAPRSRSAERAPARAGARPSGQTPALRPDSGIANTMWRRATAMKSCAVPGPSWPMSSTTTSVSETKSRSEPLRKSDSRLR